LTPPYNKVSAVIKPGSDNAKLFLKTVKKLKDLSEREGGDAARADDHLMTQRSTHVMQLGYDPSEIAQNVLHHNCRSSFLELNAVPPFLVC
jgi:hypothetical protein